MKSVTSLFLSLSVLAVAVADASRASAEALYGTWNVKVTPEAREAAKKFGLLEPKVQLTFLPSGQFEYMNTVNGQVLRKKGKFDLRENLVNFAFDEPDVTLPVTATWNAIELKVNDLSFVKLPQYDLIGTWVYTNGRGTDPGIRIQFGKDGSFSFKCSNAVSKGKYQLEGRSLTLLWTEVDGEKIQLGAMKRTFQIDEDGSGFQIDRFRYVRG